MSASGETTPHTQKVISSLSVNGYLQLAESLVSFCGKLRRHPDTLDVRERQQILRLLVRE